MERIVFLDRDSIQANFRAPTFEHEWQDYPSSRAEEIVDRLRSATIAITNKIPLRRDTLERLPDLQMIAVSATGVDCVDLDCCRERRVVVSNVRGYANRAVPEHVLMLVLALRRNLVSYRAQVNEGAWAATSSFCLFGEPIHDLHNSTLGIIGYGTLGRAVERLAHAFGMQVLIANHKGASSVRPGRASFDEVLGISDVITLHCPLTEETRGLIGAAELKQMRKTALLINCGRGGLVDEAALVAALQNGTIAGAGIDVLSEEPPRAGNPLLEITLPNLIVTPHVAWASQEAMQTLADQLVDNLEAFAGGTPQNVVT